MKEKGGYVYIMCNKNNSVLYTGSTEELGGRIAHHKDKSIKNSFTARYNINKLVYYEELDSLKSAILREKQIKAGSRKKKVELINKMNPEWRDLSEDWNLDD